VLDNTTSTEPSTLGADALCAAAGQAVAAPARARTHRLRRTREVKRIIARVARG
jgi:hypothetical protein